MEQGCLGLQNSFQAQQNVTFSSCENFPSLHISGSQSCCTSESPTGFDKQRCPDLIPRDSDLIVQGWGICIFKALQVILMCSQD